MTLIEVLIAVAILGIVIAAVGSATGMFAATVDASKDRSDRAVARAALDARVSEVSRTAPQLGDLTVVGANTLSFRKRQAPSASICSYASPTVQVRMTASELANIRAGDSVAVRDGRNTPDPSDDIWDLGVVQSATQTGVCNGQPTIAATMTPAPAAGTLVAGATVRMWSTRSYTVQPAPTAEVGSLSGSILVETVNGASPSRAYGPFVTGPVFTYLDANGNTAASAAGVRLVRATFAPIGQRQRQAVTLRAEHMEWPIASSAINVTGTAGDVPVVAGPSTSTPRCNTPGATNYGSMTDPCAFPPPVAVASAAPSPVTTGVPVTFDLSGSYDVGGNAVNQYKWVIGGTTYTSPTVSLNLAPGNVCWTAQVTNSRNLTSSQQSGCVAVYARPVAVAQVNPNPITTGQTITYDPSGSTGNGRSLVKCEWVVDGTTYNNCSSGTLSAPAPGQTCWSLRVQTDLGAWSDPVSGCMQVYALPTAQAAVSPSTQNVGDYVTLSAAALDGKGRAIAGYNWSSPVASRSSSFYYYCPAPGTYSGALQVQNDLGVWGPWSSTSITCVSNPVAQASVPASTTERYTVTFNAGNSYTPGGSISAYNWWINGVQYYSGSSSVSLALNSPGTVSWQVQVQNQWGTWSGWQTGSVQVNIDPCQYNGSISKYSSSCVPPDPPCPYAGAPAGLTQSNARCNPWQNAVSFSSSPSYGSVSGGMGDSGGFYCTLNGVSSDHTLNILCNGNLSSGSQISNYSITFTAPPATWSMTYCSLPGRCAINNTSTPNGYINAANVGMQFQGVFAISPTQSPVSAAASTKFRFMGTPIDVTMTTYKDWSKP